MSMWEWHVTQPDQNFDYENPEVEHNEKFQVEDEREAPIVVIFGWAGALDKYLKAYAKLYSERGLPTIRFITPFNHMVFQSNKMLKIGEEMADTFRKQNLNDRPIIIHALSNGGCYQYEVFMRALRRNPEEHEVRGMIFDSCPVRRKPMSLYKAIEAYVQSEHFKVPISVYLTGYAILKRNVDMRLAGMMRRECIQMNPYANLMNENCRWPQHFIYSSIDRVVDAKSVESFAEHRKSLGVDVTMQRYENSQHVQHYLKNKSSYVRSVVKFVNKCLKK